MSTTCPNTPHTPIANQLNETHSVLYGQNMQYINGQSGSLSVGNPMPVSTPFQSYPMAPPTTPANALNGNPSQLIVSPQSPHLSAMYEIFEKFMFDCSQKLQKLDLLDQIINKIDVMEKKYDNLEKNIYDIQLQINSQNIYINETTTRTTTVEQNMNSIKMENNKMQCENLDLKNRVVEMQTRSMRDNLIFKGIPDVSDFREQEDTEGKLKTFIATELEIEGGIPFHVVHTCRLRARQDNGPRSIVAKFERRKDRQKVLAAAKEKLAENRNYIVHEQFPQEVIERRRQLVPIMKDARNKGHVAYLRDDKLYVDHRRFYPGFYEARPQVPAQDNRPEAQQQAYPNNRTLVSVPPPPGPAIPGPQGPLQRAPQPEPVINQ